MILYHIIFFNQNLSFYTNDLLSSINLCQTTHFIKKNYTFSAPHIKRMSNPSIKVKNEI